MAIPQKARAASKTNTLPRSYWDWEEMLKPNQGGYFPYRPATNLLYGLREAIAGMREEGLPAVFARHERMAKATRAAVQGWAREVLCEAPSEDSPVLTAVVMPGGHDADAFRQFALDRFNISLGAGLSKLSGQVFRIGHLGECNDLMLMGALSGVEMAPARQACPINGAVRPRPCRSSKASWKNSLPDRRPAGETLLSASTAMHPEAAAPLSARSGRPCRLNPSRPTRPSRVSRADLQHASSVVSLGQKLLHGDVDEATSC